MHFCTLFVWKRIAVRDWETGRKANKLHCYRHYTLFILQCQNGKIKHIQIKTAETKLVSVIFCYRFIPFALHQSYTRRLHTSQTNLHTFIVHAKQMLWLLEEYQTFWHLCPNNLFTETCDKIMFLINFY